MLIIEGQGNIKMMNMSFPKFLFLVEGFLCHFYEPKGNYNQSKPTEIIKNIIWNIALNPLS